MKDLRRLHAEGVGRVHACFYREETQSSLIKIETREP